jgi:hypothetical protein
MTTVQVARRHETNDAKETLSCGQWCIPASYMRLLERIGRTSVHQWRIRSSNRFSNALCSQALCSLALAQGIFAIPGIHP